MAQWQEVSISRAEIQQHFLRPEHAIRFLMKEKGIPMDDEIPPELDTWNYMFEKIDRHDKPFITIRWRER